MISKAADALQAAYRRETGQSLCAGAAPDGCRTHRGSSPRPADSRGRNADGPAGMAVDALKAAGRDPAEADRMVRRGSGSRQAQAIDDLMRQRARFGDLLAFGRGRRNDLAVYLATLSHNKALVNLSAGDLPGALAAYDSGIQIFERLVNREGWRELANFLATCYTSKAIAVTALGDNRAVVALCDRAIEIRERLVNQEGRRELADDLAACYAAKAAAIDELGDYRAAVALYDRAIEIHERLVNQEGRWELTDSLANSYANKANAVKRLGDNRAALALYDRAIEVYERMVNQEERWEAANELANCYTNKAVAIGALGDHRERWRSATARSRFASGSSIRRAGGNCAIGWPTAT